MPTITRPTRLRPSFCRIVLFAPSAAIKIFCAVFILGCLDDDLVCSRDYIFDSLSFARDNSALARALEKTVIELLSAYNMKMVVLFVS